MSVSRLAREIWLAYVCNTNPTKSCKLAACCLLRLIPRRSIIWLVKPFLLFFVSWCNSHEKRYQGLSCFTELQSDKAGWGLGTREERCLSVQCLPHTPAHDAHNIHLLMPHTLTTLIYHPPPPPPPHTHTHTHTHHSPPHTQAYLVCLLPVWLLDRVMWKSLLNSRDAYLKTKAKQE